MRGGSPPSRARAPQELVAATEEEYVDIAVRLLVDDSVRYEVQRKIAATPLHAVSDRGEAALYVSVFRHAIAAKVVAEGGVDAECAERSRNTAAAQGGLSADMLARMACERVHTVPFANALGGPLVVGGTGVVEVK